MATNEFRKIDPAHSRALNPARVLRAVSTPARVNGARGAFDALLGQYHGNHGESPAPFAQKTARLRKPGAQDRAKAGQALPLGNRLDLLA